MKDYSFYLHIATPLLFAAMALFFLGIAGRAWKGGRPFLLSQRWLFGLMCLGFLPSFVNPLLFHSARTPASLVFMGWISPAMMLCLLLFFWFQMRGYMVFAVTEKSFRDAFRAAAAALGYTVEESLASMRLQPGDLPVRVSLQSWMGVGQIRADRKNVPLIGSLARGMNAHYAAHGGETNHVTTAFYAVTGLFMVAMAVAMGCLKLGK